MQKDKKEQKSKYNIWVLLGGALIWLFMAVYYFCQKDTQNGFTMLVIGAIYTGVFVANMKQKQREKNQ